MMYLGFHVSHLKELLGSSDNIITIETLVTLEDLTSKRHVPQRILNVKPKHPHSTTI